VNSTHYGIAAGLVILLLVGCGESTPDEERYGRADTSIAAGITPSDTGILQDPSSYQPARVPEGSTSVEQTAAPRGGGAMPTAQPRAGDTASEVAVAVADFTNLIRDGEVEEVLRMFPDQQVAAWGEDEIDALYVTSEKLMRIDGTLESKLDAEQAAKLSDQLRGIAAAPEWEIHDAEHATVRPNVAALILGPERAGETIKLTKIDGAWTFELDQPLSAEDSAALAVFHQNMHTALDQIDAWLQAAEEVDQAALTAAIEKIWQGEPVELAAPAETQEEEPERRTRSSGRGRRAMPRNP
jgi:hypothetical protein